MTMQTVTTPNGQVTTVWEKCLAKRTDGMGSSIIREILKYAQQPDIISFAGGLPAPELFPVQDVQEACRHVLEHKGAEALQYSVTEGYPPLKGYLVEKVRKYGVLVEESNILLTNGSQQALDLIGKIFIDPGDVILTEAPTYLGGLQAFGAYQARYVTVPLDDDGMQVDKVEDILAKEPVKFIYVLPNFHNPAGVTLSYERRLKLVELAAKYGVFIVEDDPYGALRFEGEDITPLYALHKENVLYLSTFSKTLSPGIRLGWIAAPAEIIARLVQAKQGTDLHTSTFIQMIAHNVCQRGLIHHVQRIRQVYKERRDIMLASMEKHFPEGVTWTRPQGGLFLWVTLPEHVDTAEFLQVALEEKVAFVPGFAFYPGGGGGKNSMRLNFSNAGPEMIEEGIKRLGRALIREFG
jgi:2-aminoadipate transaminase